MAGAVSTRLAGAARAAVRRVGPAAACGAAVLVLAGCGAAGEAITFSTTPSTPSTSTTGTTTGATVTDTVPIDNLIGPNGLEYESNPQLAAVSTHQTGAPIHGILCQSLRQLAHQAAAHLQIYVAGHPRALPGGVGMVGPSLSQTSSGPAFTASDCYYWLHTATQDGVILTESPVQHSYTLGDFFAIWHQRLSRTRVGPAHGRVTAIINGHPWTGDPRAIRLHEHESIELAVGRPVPRFKATSWAASTL